jgi:predicted RND superfamily exporter protein
LTGCPPVACFAAPPGTRAARVVDSDGGEAMRNLERLVRWYADLAIRRPWLLLALYTAMTLVSVVLATRLELKTDLKDLLPGDAQSVIALDEARSRQGSSDKFVIAVESPDPLATLRFIDAIHAELADWPEAESIEVKQDREFLRRHALVFLHVEDLQRIKENVQRLVRKKLAEHNPLFIDLESDGSGTAEAIEEVNWRDPFAWIDPVSLAELGVTDEQIAEARAAIDEAVGEGSGEVSEGSGAVAAPRGPPRAPGELERIAKLPKKYADYLVARGGTTAVLTARLKGRSTDTAYARQAYEYGTAAIARLDPTSFHPELRAMVVGPYRSYLEVKQVADDASWATSLSVGLVIFLLVLFFRNLRSLPIILPALFVGQAWTFGIIELTYGRLNILTAFVFAMLVGMGIDFAIHVYGRSREQYDEGHAWPEAIFLSLWKTGRALISAWLTTVVALIMLVFAHFEGFKEFGVVCTLGVTICLLSTFLVVPALIGATERVSASKRRAKPSAAAGAPGRGIALMRGAALIVAAVAVLGAVVAPRIEFEYNLKKLQSGGPRQTIRYGSALGAGKSSTPAVILGQSEAQMREVHQVLRQRLKEKDPMLNSFLTVETFLPSDMDARLEVIADLHDVLDRRAVRNIGGKEGDAVDALLELSDVEKFGPEELPDWIRRPLTEKDGTFGRIGVLYGNYNDADAKSVEAFQQRYQSIPTSMGDARVSTSGFIISDVVRYVQADGERIFWLVMVSLVLVLLLDFRNLFATAICLVALAAGSLITVAWMWLFDMKLGLFNMVVLPTALGIGIDGATHIYHRYTEEGRDRLWFILRTTGNSVVAAALTTVSGFVGLLFVDHQGIRTLGQLAVVSISVCMVASIGLLPGLLTLARDRRVQREESPAG